MTVRSYIALLLFSSALGGLLLTSLIQQRNNDLSAKRQQEGLDSLAYRELGHAGEQIDQLLVTYDLIVGNGVTYLHLNAEQQFDSLNKTYAVLARAELFDGEKVLLDELQAESNKLRALVQERVGLQKTQTSTQARTTGFAGRFDSASRSLVGAYKKIVTRTSEKVQLHEKILIEAQESLPKTIIGFILLYVLGVLALWFWTVSRLVKPIESLTADAERAMATGEAYVHQDSGPREIYRMSTVLHRFISSLSEQVSDRTQKLTLALTELQEAQSSLVDERDQAEEKVHNRTEELNQALSRETKLVDVLDNANKKLSHSMKLKDQFLANMSHELRTPLNAVLGLSEALAEQIYGPVNEAQAKALGTVDSSGRHLLSLINEILDLSKIEAGKMENYFEPTQMDGICRSVIDSVKNQADKKKQTLTYSNTSTQEVIVVDAQRLRQALFNLVGNAVKFTPAGKKVGLEVTDEREGLLVRFRVWDEGPGIPKEQQPLLFEPFVQLDGGLARQSEGTGLGLAIVHRMAEALGWKISVDSELGKGTNFYLDVPTHDNWSDSESTVEMSAAFIRNATGDVPKVCRVLMVDDNLENVRYLKDFMESVGYVVWANNGAEEGLETFIKEEPQIIMTDIQMPGIDGFEFMRRIRSMKGGNKVKIFAVTAYAHADEQNACMEAGADLVLTKPLSIKALQSALSI